MTNNDDRYFFAHKIAKDLHNFMSSFSADSGSSDTLIVPSNIFNRWMQRFEDKYRRDPNFMMKS